MNYQAIYDRLIARAGRRALGEYSERHHILPKCLGGNNQKDNIVRLLPEEHYLAHQLLVRIHPSNLKLVQAAVLMSAIGKAEGRGPKNKLHGWLKRRMSSMMKNVPKSEETKAKIAASLRGKPHPNGGWSIEAKNRRSEAAKGAGNNQFGVKRSAETIAKMSAAVKGEKHPLYGKTGAACHKFGIKRTEEEKRKISKSLTGRKQTPELVAKRVASYKKTVEARNAAKSV